MKKGFKIALLLLALSVSLVGQASENPFGRSGEIFEDEAPSESGKSKWAAAGLSLLVPGAGEIFLGDSRGAGYFLAAEGAIWGTFAGLNIKGNWLKEDYQNYAAIHAGVDTDGKNDQFYKDILSFDSRDDYNTWYHLVYRDEVPFYPETDEYFWDWESDDAYEEYSELRSDSETAYRNAKITLAVAMVNRLISVVHVMRYSPEQADLVEEANGLGLRPIAYTAPSPDGKLSLGLGISGSF